MPLGSRARPAVQIDKRESQCESATAGTEKRITCKTRMRRMPDLRTYYRRSRSDPGWDASLGFGAVVRQLVLRQFGEFGFVEQGVDDLRVGHLEHQALTAFGLVVELLQAVDLDAGLLRVFVDLGFDLGGR